ncbi:MAG: hypothetical protein V7K92_00030 [Nostoc sp.]|uniref:hypothetical protein n=1 Tax=Nostoc sp. TaxID=1180 RepID=UPI002FF0D3D1
MCKQFEDLDLEDKIFTFKLLTISPNLLNQIKSVNMIRQEEVFIQRIHPKKTVLQVRSGSSKVDIAFDLGDNFIFLVNSYKNSQADSPHIIDGYNEVYFTHYWKDEFDLNNKNLELKTSFSKEIQNFKGFYGTLTNKQHLLESIFNGEGS